MRIGLYRGDTASGPIDKILGAARDAATAGYSSFWLPQTMGMDAMAALAIVGREVPDIELGTAVVPTYPRHPMMLAQQALTVQAASGGRLTLGIGLSHQMVIENMFGLSFEKPVRHMREYLSTLMPLLQTGSAAFEGDVFNVHASIDVPGSTAPPVLVAALGEKMRTVAGTLADGTMTWMTGPEPVASHTVPTI